MELVIGVDIGTSGLRAQAMDANKKGVVSTAISLHNPLPGANSVEHLHFAMRAGPGTAQSVVIDAVNTLLRSLDVDLKCVKRLALCGNPTQLSIFQGIEIRDLAYGGDRTLKGMGLKRLDRRSQVVSNASIGLAINPEAEVLIPPAVRQQIGADALAMLIKSDILARKGNCMVTDYGTNAEIGLKVGDDIYTGSCAAGPAIEGGELERGMLASPGAISDISPNGAKPWKLKVLNSDMFSTDSYSVDPVSGIVMQTYPTHTPPRGITGTGTIALVAAGFETGLIKRLPPFVMTPDSMIHLSKADDIFVTSKDYVNASRCFGAFKAGHTSLVAKSGIPFSEIDAMYMCGAGGTYVDALKAQAVGLLPPTVSEIYQIGNTSLAMADSIALDPEWLDRMQSLADSLRGTYHDFATDNVFQQSFMVEMEHFERGLKPEDRPELEKALSIPQYPATRVETRIHRAVKRDISDFGRKGLHVISRASILLSMRPNGCIGCRSCEDGCMTKALRVMEEGDGFRIEVASERCTGHACLKCEFNCKEKVFRFDDLEFKPGKKAW